MGFLDSLSKKTSEFGKKTSEATSKIAKETKLKLKINENKGKIKTLYEEIGKKVYENHVKNVEDEKEFINGKCAEIDGLADEIESAKKEIMVLNNRKNCQNCSAEIENSATFCPNCGAKQEEVKEEIVIPKEEVESKETKSDAPNEEVKKEEE